MIILDSSCWCFPSLMFRNCQTVNTSSVCYKLMLLPWKWAELHQVKVLRPPEGLRWSWEESLPPPPAVPQDCCSVSSLDRTFWTAVTSPREPALTNAGGGGPSRWGENRWEEEEANSKLTVLARCVIWKCLDEKEGEKCTAAFFMRGAQQMGGKVHATGKDLKSVECENVWMHGEYGTSEEAESGRRQRLGNG